LKFPRRWKLDELKQRLVLTSEEKRVISFVLIAFVLGLGTKCYREAHPQSVPDVDKKHPWRTRATPSTASSPPKTQRKSRKKKQSPMPLPSPSVLDENESDGRD